MLPCRQCFSPAVMLSMITVQIQSTILKREYKLWKSAMGYAAAKTHCSPGHLVDLRPEFRASIVHQLLPFYHNGTLNKTEFLWIGLERDFPGGQFRWFDNEIQADLNMSSFTYASLDDQDDNEDCVATKKRIPDVFIIRVEPCSMDLFPFCEVETGKPCDYSNIGHLVPTPTGDYFYNNLTLSRLQCESVCTNLRSISPYDCWMYAHNNASQSCRVIFSTVMPHWKDTCDWFEYDSDWETWKRNCLDVKVFDENGREINLGTCGVPTQSDSEMTTSSSTGTSAMGMTSSSVVDLPLTSHSTYVPVTSRIMEDTSSSSSTDITQATPPVNEIRPLQATSSTSEPLASFAQQSTAKLSTDLEVDQTKTSPYLIDSSSGQTNQFQSTSPISVTPNFQTLAVMGDTHTPTQPSTDVLAHVLLSTSTFSDPDSATAAVATISEAISSLSQSANTESTNKLVDETSEPISIQASSTSAIMDAHTKDLISKYLNPPTTQPTAKEGQLCTCSCNETNLVRRGNNSFISEVLDSLHIDVKNTSAYRRQHTSVRDERPLAVGLGWSGVSILVFVAGGILILDFKLLLHDTVMLFKTLKSIDCGRKT